MKTSAKNGHSEIGWSIHAKRLLGRTYMGIVFVPLALLVACGAPARAPNNSLSESDYGYQFDVDPATNAKASPASDLSLPHAAGDRIPPETVQAIVRSHYADIGSCYAVGLTRQPSLAGTVTVKVTAGADGATQRAEDDSSTLADKDVVSCVVGRVPEDQLPARRWKDDRSLSDRARALSASPRLASPRTARVLVLTGARDALHLS